MRYHHFNHIICILMPSSANHGKAPEKWLNSLPTGLGYSLLGVQEEWKLESLLVGFQCSPEPKHYFWDARYPGALVGSHALHYLPCLVITEQLWPKSDTNWIPFIFTLHISNAHSTQKSTLRLSMLRGVIRHSAIQLKCQYLRARI